jgi:hypothetical protein
VVNVSDAVPAGVISAIFGWQGPTDSNEFGEPRFYANNLIAGGPLQQTSNGAFFKNTRAALKKVKRPRITAENAPDFSLKPRYGPVDAIGAAGDPRSKAKNFVDVTL